MSIPDQPLQFPVHPDPLKSCAQCAVDDEHYAWHAEQVLKSAAASERFARRRAAMGLPLIRKKAGERF